MEEEKKVMTDRELKRLIRKRAKGGRPKGSFKRTLAMAAMLVTVLPVFGSVLYSAYSSAKSEEALQEQPRTAVRAQQVLAEHPPFPSPSALDAHAPDHIPHAPRHKGEQGVVEHRKRSAVAMFRMAPVFGSLARHRDHLICVSQSMVLNQ